MLSLLKTLPECADFKSVRLGGSNLNSLAEGVARQLRG
jgi:hypothetical protein